MRVPAEKPEAFRTAGGGAADSGLEQQDACKDQSLLPPSEGQLAGRQAATSCPRELARWKKAAALRSTH
jgi:hypothetical protein